MIEETRPRGRGALQWCAVALVVLLAAPGAMAAPELRIEAESFESVGWYNIGGADIAPGYCSYASGSLTADGLDVPGEWIMLKVKFTVAGCYSSRIDYQSAYGETTRVAVRLLDYPEVGEELRAEYGLTEGYGYG